MQEASGCSEKNDGEINTLSSLVLDRVGTLDISATVAPRTIGFLRYACSAQVCPHLPTQIRERFIALRFAIVFDS